MQIFRTLTFAVVFLAIGCASGYSQFYTDMSQGAKNKFLPPNAEPTIFSSSGDADQDVRKMFEDGYALIGRSGFNGESESQSGALKQAKKIGAERVIISVEYDRTISGAVPLTTTQAVTTYENGIANAYGPGGTVYGNYSGSKTTYVPTTTYIPYSSDRYDQTALYFGPMVAPCFGVLQSELSDADKQRAGTNKGFRVDAVRRGSPAYDADILPGDIILSIDDKPITETTPIGASGQSVRIGILREGGKSYVPVTLGTCV